LSSQTSAIPIESASAEPLEVTVTAKTDPTGSAVEFQVSSTTVTTPAGSWTAGSWDSSWDATTRKATALTPTIGAAGSLIIVEGQTYQLWVRFASTVVKRARLIHAS